MPSRYDPDLVALGDLLEGEPAYRARQVFDGLHRRLVGPDDMTDLPKELRERLAALLPNALTLAAERHTDRGDTVKLLWSLHDGAAIETVLMHYPGRTTVCVSTQAGCAMGCGFCARGQAGFDRHLRVGDMVVQVVRAAQLAAPRRVSNVVLMGMGEPLANYDNVWPAIERMHGAIGISARHITVSTVGIVPGIKRLAREQLPVNLAVSLHAANDAVRNQLVPINKRYPIGSLTAACREYLAAKNRRLSFEWALIEGVNDRRADVVELAELARPLRAHVNLIPLNPTPGWPTTGSSPERVRWFRDRLVEHGANATIRQNRGTDIDAACGQLRATHVGIAPTR
jgi:23S rRNA (adenine2503-C2)-methyltransferase